MTACSRMGFKIPELFDTIDLYEEKDIMKV
jgi:hypothetical protein